MDFLMLEHYWQIYKSLLEPKEGPRFMTTINGTKTQKMFLEAENETATDDFNKRIEEGVRAALKECGGDGSTYTPEQRQLMVWYTYFFLQRGKPTTHIEAISKMSKAQLLQGMPRIFSRIILDAEKMLTGDIA